MPTRYTSSADTHAMVARIAPSILGLLGDGISAGAGVGADSAPVTSCTRSFRTGSEGKLLIYVGVGG